jgi:hypothetical protein
MRTYRDVSRGIAEDVAAGKLASGSALPSVRTAALRYDTTAAERLISALRDPGVQDSVSALGGYDLSRTGTVQLLA